MGFMKDKEIYTPKEVAEIIVAYQEYQRVVGESQTSFVAGNAVNAQRAIEIVEEHRKKIPKNIRDLLD